MEVAPAKISGRTMVGDFLFGLDPILDVTTVVLCLYHLPGLLEPGPLSGIPTRRTFTLHTPHCQIVAAVAAVRLTLSRGL